MRRDIVFVHIPKTAGTSLRSLLEEFADNHTVLRDYGNVPQTSPELYKLVYDEERIADFRQTFGRRNKGIVLSGHFPAARYWDHFNAESFVTFLRHPVERVISEYVHFINVKGWKGSLEEFARRPGANNTLSRFLKGVDLENFGFIGFAEEFDAAGPALNAWLGASLPLRKKNVGDYARAGLDVRGDGKDRDLVADLNAEDIVLYERLRGLRGQRPSAAGASPEISNSYVGVVRRQRNGVIAGYLFNTAREFISRVEISANGEAVGTIEADKFRGGTREEGSRSGVCGFRVNVNDIVPPARTAGPLTLAFRAQGADYELEGSPIEIASPS